MKPTLAVFMICKNEEKHIGRAIRSVLPCADHLVVVDTGSTDATRAAALRASGDVPIYFETYTDASERDETGDWKLWDFARARNHAAEIAEKLGASWLLWMDADDELQDPAKVRRAMLRDDVDTFSLFIESGGQRWLHQRLWKASKHVRFKGRVHEYPVIDGLRSTMLYALVKHDLEPIATQENANPRNLRILMREWEENPDARTSFYIGCTHKDAGRHRETVEWMHRRIAFGECYRDEYLFALLYLARSLSALGDHDGAEQALTFALDRAPDWQEFRMELANVHYRCKRYGEAIAVALDALDKPPTPTALWREVSAYRDQPARLISWCHEHEGRIADAVAWARMAADRIGKVDPEWNARIDRLQSLYLDRMRPPAIVTRPAREKIALVRPGAIGDILMTLNLIPAFRDEHPDAELHYFCAPQLGAPEALGGTMAAAGVDLVLDVGGLGAWRKTYQSVTSLVGYPLHEGYPDKPMRRHLLQYFGDEMGLRVDRGALPSLELRRPKRPDNFIGPRHYVTLQTRAGWSKYKEWNDRLWAEIVARAGMPFVQIGDPSAPKIPGAIRYTGTLSQTIAVVANADFHVGIDSFANHLTNFLWSDDRGARRVPGVILWGSTQESAAGYRDNVNISRALSCQPCFRENPAISTQPRGPCVNPPRASYDDNTPHACMVGIIPEDVICAIDLVQRSL